MARRRPLFDAVASGLAGLAIFAFFGRTFLGYDTFYALLWGGDLAHGRMPDYRVPVAPTPHPLAVLAGVPASLFGGGGEPVMLALVIAALGALVVGMFRLGERLFGWPVGLLAALIVATRVPFLNYGVRGYVDLVELALVVWAAVLEARTPRRGWAVLALLAVAGLLRPEAWLYSLAYWLWLFPARSWAQRLRLALLVVAPPLAWGFSDLAISGDFLWSLHGTHDLASALGRETGLGNAFRTAPRRLGEIVRLPELIAALVGLGFGLAWRPRRVALPAAMTGLNGLAFAVFALAGLSLLGRYLFLAGVMLALFAAVGCLGWLEHRDRLWRLTGSVALAAIVVFFGLQQVDRLGSLRTDIRARARVQADLHSLALAPCRPLYVPDHRLVPLLAYWHDLRPARILAQSPVTSFGELVLPANARVQRLSILDPHEPRPRTLGTPPGWRLRASNRSWLLYTGPKCRRKKRTVHPPSKSVPERARQSVTTARLPRGAWAVPLKAASSRI